MGTWSITLQDSAGNALTGRNVDLYLGNDTNPGNMSKVADFQEAGGEYRVTVNTSAVYTVVIDGVVSNLALKGVDILTTDILVTIANLENTIAQIQADVSQLQTDVLAITAIQTNVDEINALLGDKTFADETYLDSDKDLSDNMELLQSAIKSAMSLISASNITGANPYRTIHQGEALEANLTNDAAAGSYTAWAQDDTETTKLKKKFYKSPNDKTMLVFFEGATAGDAGIILLYVDGNNLASKSIQEASYTADSFSVSIAGLSTGWHELEIKIKDTTAPPVGDLVYVRKNINILVSS